MIQYIFFNNYMCLSKYSAFIIDIFGNIVSRTPKNRPKNVLHYHDDPTSLPLSLNRINKSRNSQSFWSANACQVYSQENYHCYARLHNLVPWGVWECVEVEATISQPSEATTQRSGNGNVETEFTAYLYCFFYLWINKLSF